MIDEQLPCDGCGLHMPVAVMKRIRDYGAEVRYCHACCEIYLSFVTAVKAKEAASQHEMDTWQLTMRMQVPLTLMPMDFPPGHPLVILDAPADQKPLVLG